MTGIWRVIKSDRDVVDKMTDAVGAKGKKNYVRRWRRSNLRSYVEVRDREWPVKSVAATLTISVAMSYAMLVRMNRGARAVKARGSRRRVEFRSAASLLRAPLPLFNPRYSHKDESLKQDKY